MNQTSKLLVLALSLVAVGCSQPTTEPEPPTCFGVTDTLIEPVVQTEVLRDVVVVYDPEYAGGTVPCEPGVFNYPAPEAFVVECGHYQASATSCPEIAQRLIECENILRNSCGFVPGAL